MARYDYRCESGHVTDTFRPMSCDAIACRECGAAAKRIISSGAAITHRETDSRGMFRRFTEASAEIDHVATQRESVGETVQTPNFWRQAKATAQKIEQAGEAKETREKLSRR